MMVRRISRPLTCLVRFGHREATGHVVSYLFFFFFLRTTPSFLEEDIPDSSLDHLPRRNTGRFQSWSFAHDQAAASTLTLRPPPRLLGRARVPASTTPARPSFMRVASRGHVANKSTSPCSTLTSFLPSRDARQSRRTRMSKRKRRPQPLDLPRWRLSRAAGQAARVQAGQ